MYTGMSFRALSGFAGGRGLPGHSQSLTVLVEVGHFPSAAVGRPKSDFPWQRPESTRLPLAQSGSDCAQKGTSIFESSSWNYEIEHLTKLVLYAAPHLTYAAL